MTNPNDKIIEARTKVHDLGITTDRDLVKQLGIKDEDKAKLWAWIEYQSAFEFSHGYRIGQDELKDALKNLLDIKE